MGWHKSGQPCGGNLVVSTLHISEGRYLMCMFPCLSRRERFVWMHHHRADTYVQTWILFRFLRYVIVLLQIKTLVMRLFKTLELERIGTEIKSTIICFILCTIFSSCSNKKYHKFIFILMKGIKCNASAYDRICQTRSWRIQIIAYK